MLVIFGIIQGGCCCWQFIRTPTTMWSKCRLPGIGAAILWNIPGRFSSNDNVLIFVCCQKRRHAKSHFKALCDLLYSEMGITVWKSKGRMTLEENPLSRALPCWQLNKTISDGGITVDFRFIKVHTSNWSSNSGGSSNSWGSSNTWGSSNSLNLVWT